MADSTVTPVADVPELLLVFLAASIQSAPRGGTVRLQLRDGDRDGAIAVDVEEARAYLGLDFRS